MAYPVQTKKSTAPKSVDQPSGSKKDSESGSLARGAMTLIIFLLVIVGGIYFIKTFSNRVTAPQYNFTGEYQAIFLTTGQVYFGKVQMTNMDLVILRDIYYLQVVNQPLQGTQEVGEGEQPVPGDEQRLTLVKLGNELHGPKDEMFINGDHIVLAEDLRDDSRVIQAIRDHQANVQ